jgi:UDP-glucose 4-epimerase
MILITGGAGYIGSHAAVELLAAGHDVFIIDNFCNSKLSVLDRIERVAGRRPGFLQIDIRDRMALRRLFSEHTFEAVMHFAGLKAVGDSVAHPLIYYDNNVSGSVALIECMVEVGLKRMVFSSSATVYGELPTVQFREDLPTAPCNPYGRSKRMIEEILLDVAKADPAWRVALLRYFNPVGAHASGMIGEDPSDTPNNLMPYIAQVAMGKLKELSVYGADYPTKDGTGVRDYIHVSDLAHGHLLALKKLTERPGILTLNLGTGQGYSVLEMINAFSRVSGRQVPYRIVDRRPGDIAEFYADPALAREVLGWEATFGIDSMCADSWRWQCWAAEN